MKKKLIIYTALVVTLIAVIILTIFFINKPKKSNETNLITDKITISKYDGYKVVQTIDITDSQRLNDFNKIYESIALGDASSIINLAIKNDVKVDLNNGTHFFIQLDLESYCYFENDNDNTKQIIKMPDGLMDFVESTLAENNK